MRAVVKLPDGKEAVHQGPFLGLKIGKTGPEAGALLVLKLSARGAVLGTIRAYLKGEWSKANLHRDKFRRTRAPIYVAPRSNLLH